MKKFNLHNQTEMQLIRVLANGEGLISRDEFLKISNKTMFSRYRSENYIKPFPNGEKGIFQITNKFKQAYLKINPSHKFSGSGSVNHSRKLNQIIATLPKGAKIITGQEIKMGFEQFKKSRDYQNAMLEIQKRNAQEVHRCETNLKLAKTEKEKAVAFQQLDKAEKLLNLSFSPSACSTPDLSISISRDECQELINSLILHSQNQLHYKHEQTYERAIARLQAIIQETKEEKISIAIEIISDSYGALEIQAKENYSEVIQTHIIYLPTS